MPVVLQIVRPLNPDSQNYKVLDTSSDGRRQKKLGTALITRNLSGGGKSGFFGVTSRGPNTRQASFQGRTIRSVRLQIVEWYKRFNLNKLT